MTTFASFITKSSTGARNLYVMSDSRITWTLARGQKEIFDYSTKIFPFNKSPDILVYCGDSTFALSTLSRIKIQLEFSEQFTLSSDYKSKASIVNSYLDNALKYFPAKFNLAGSIICYFTYSKGEFYGFEFSPQKKSKSFKQAPIPIGQDAGIFFTAGSGSAVYSSSLKGMIKKYSDTVHVLVYSFFCHLRSGNDSATGGAPQIVMIDSTGKLKPIAVVSNGNVNFLGEQNSFWLRQQNIDYRGEYFELLDSNGVRFSHEKDRSFLKRK